MPKTEFRDKRKAHCRNVTYHFSLRDQFTSIKLGLLGGWGGGGQTQAILYRYEVNGAQMVVGGQSAASSYHNGFQHFGGDGGKYPFVEIHADVCIYPGQFLLLGAQEDSQRNIHVLQICIERFSPCII